MNLLSHAIDRLVVSGFSTSEIAHALGVTDAELRDLRAARQLPFVDEAPEDWYRALAEMAWQRGGLESLAHKLERA